MPLDLTKVFDVEVRFGLDNTEFLNKLNKIGQDMTRVGRTMTAGITLPIIAMGTAAINASMNFNTGMANVATLIPGNIDRVNELKQGVQELSIATAQSTDKMTSGLYQVISAFGDTEDTLAQLDINARMASAGMATVEQAVNLTSAVTKGYGDTSAQAMEKVADLSLLVVRLGQTTFPELASSIGRVTPVAASLNVSQEELMATYATLTGVVGDAAEVSTGLRGAMVALMKPTPAMSAAMRDLGYANAESMIQANGLVQSLQMLAGTTDGTGQALMELFPNVRVLPSLLSLAGANAETFNQKLQEMYQASGTLDEAFNEVANGVNAVGFQWNQMKEQFKVMLQQLGDALMPMLAEFMTNHIIPLIGHITSLVEWFSNLDPVWQQTILTVVGLVAALGPLLLIIGQIITIAPALGTAASFMFGPWGLAIAGVIIALSALTAWIGNVIRKQEELLDANADQITSLQNTQTEINNLCDDLDDLSGDTETTSEQFDTLNTRFRNIIDTNPDLREELGLSYDDMGNLVTQSGEVIDTLEELQTVMNNASASSFVEQVNASITALSFERAEIMRNLLWKKYLWDVGYYAEMAGQGYAMPWDFSEYVDQRVAAEMAAVQTGGTPRPVGGTGVTITGGEGGETDLGDLGNDLDNFNRSAGSARDTTEELTDAQKAWNGMTDNYLASLRNLEATLEANRIAHIDTGNTLEQERQVYVNSLVALLEWIAQFGETEEALIMRAQLEEKIRQITNGLNAGEDKRNELLRQEEEELRRLNKEKQLAAQERAERERQEELDRIRADKQKAIELQRQRDEEARIQAMKDRLTKLAKSIDRAIVDSFRDLGASIVSGDIAKALQSAFKQLGDAIGNYAEEYITQQIGGGGLFGEIAGAFGGGLISAGISWIGGLFGGGKGGPSFTEDDPGWINVGNWKDYFAFGFTLPATYVMSGRASGQVELGPHGWALDMTRQGQRLGMHYDQ